MTQLIEAAGFLLFCKENPVSFLLLKHTQRWDLPKGHAEAGEDLLRTALRETEEETGISADRISGDADFKYVVEYDVRGAKRGNYRKRVTYFLGYIFDRPTPILTEHIDYQWFTWPVKDSIQEQTIDPLLAAVKLHFDCFPRRLGS